MSKVNQSVSTSASASSIDQIAAKKSPSKRKASKVRLPTPPPDPTQLDDDANAHKTRLQEADFIEYLEALQQRTPHPPLSRSTSAFAPAIVTEDAFDHLDKLYKLMEQMLTLREQNVLLHRRIKDLERLRNMQDMHRRLETEKLKDVPVPYEPDTDYAESFLYNILSESKKDLKQKFRQPLLRKSQRINIRSPLEKDDASDRRVSGVSSIIGEKQAKVSKWTKVKAAFKWEKASSVSDAKSQDSGLGLGMQPVNYEIVRYLRVPSTSEELGASPADSGTAEISTPATLSSASSAEELNRQVRRRTHEDTSDEDQIFSFDYIPVHKDESLLKASKVQQQHQPRTTWAKMKDIIQTQTRNSFKKKHHRLSTKSDELKMDGLSLASDNEDVFDVDDQKSPILIVQSPEDISKENETLTQEHNIPVDIIARYRVVNEDSNIRHISKWGKVKRAFLTSPSISRNDSKSPLNVCETAGSKAPDATTAKKDNMMLQFEIQRNYSLLQEKLSQEFQEKLQEWERSKLSTPSTSFSTSTQNSPVQEDSKEIAFKKKMEEWEKIKGQPKHNMQLQSEENLPPEFRKKLEEWKKIKKNSIKDQDSIKKKSHEWPRWRSISGHRGSETGDHKKDNDWQNTAKSSSPRMSRKESTKKIKEQTDKELQWFEKELGKIEREKMRLERDRQKFLEREERLSKIRRSVVANNKKDILVCTPSGFYRFEGISRKFTQKLYEWEKAQGIRPEESTFALLKSSCIPDIRSNKRDLAQGPLIRSKSADSIMNSEINVVPLLSQQPSSLSLNDVENLEKDILEEEDTVEIQARDIDEEPEALIVEVEDVVEETASLMENYLVKHTPVYQKQEHYNMCEGETRSAPTVRRSESRRAQANYNLIEDIINVQRRLLDNEIDIEDIENKKINTMDSNLITNGDDDEDVKMLKYKQEQQKQLASLLISKLVLLQEANSNVAENLVKDESEYIFAKFSEVLDTIHDITIDLSTNAERIDQNICRRNKYQLECDSVISSKQLYPDIMECLRILNIKILNLRRNLSYLCAASDMSVASWKRKEDHRSPLMKIPSIERKRNIYRKSRSKESSQDDKKSRSGEDSSKNSPCLGLQIEQGAIKKRMRYRQKGMASKTVDESDDEDEEEERKPKPRRMRSQNSTESNKSCIEVKKIDEVKSEVPMVVDPGVVEKVIVPTKTKHFLNVENQAESEVQDSPVTVFVKTTRKLFTPIVTSGLGNEPDSNDMPLDSAASIPHLPPILASPTPQRKIPKEISPNIRLMMVRYNQKISEEAGAQRSAGSSGSASPVAWRSPVLERRVKAQTERYQQELQKMSPLLGGRREVQKSASMGVMVSGMKQVTVHGRSESLPETSRGILKSSSTSVIQTKKIDDYSLAHKAIPEQEAECLHSHNHRAQSTSSISKELEARNNKIQRAKEEFLKSVPPTSTTCSSSDLLIRNKDEQIKYPAKNRLSQISVGSESSFNSSTYGNLLIKSASAGMINVDADVYKQFDPEVHKDGYVSLPRASSKNKEGLLSNITAKFRKVKMRRHKDKMNTVSTLCRQSLVVDINTDDSQETLSEEQSKLSLPSDSKGSSSADTSPSTSRTSSWIKRPKLFKNK